LIDRGSSLFAENNATLTSSIFLSQVETQADRHDELFDDPAEKAQSIPF